MNTGWWRGVIAKPDVEKKMGTVMTVPMIDGDWRARRDSNARPLPSEGSTLSS